MMKPWAEEHATTYRKQQISNEIRKLKRSTDPEKESKIEALRAEYKVLHAPIKERQRKKFQEFLKRVQK